MSEAGTGFKQPEEGIIRSAKSKLDSPRQLSARVQREPRRALLQVRDDSQFAMSCAVHCDPPLGSAMEGCILRRCSAIRFKGVSSKFPFRIGNFTSKAEQFLRVPRSLGPLTGLLSPKGTSKSQMWSRPARRAVENGGVAFAECKQACAPINQELDHLCVALYAGHVQWCVAKIARLIRLIRNYPDRILLLMRGE
jgi:hypothetical protein